MKRAFLTACVLAVSTTVSAYWSNGRDLTQDLPSLNGSSTETIEGFKIHRDVAQYKKGDWSGCLGIARGVSLDEALLIAKGNPEITFFFYTKGLQMVLETETDYRTFRHGDAVFFAGEPHFGSAPGLADGYVKSE